MQASSNVSSRSAERGVAVIMAMLTVALVAALAAGIVASYGFALDSVSGRQDLDQARWLARGAIDWARNVLAEDKRTSGAVDHLAEAWTTKVPPTPVEDGEVSGDITDLSGMFNLNLLADNLGAPSPFGQHAFAELLQILGVAPNQAHALSTNLGRWIDVATEAGDAYYPPLPDGARPPNAPLISVDELIQVPGFDSSIVERLRPFVTAVAPGTKLNVNTASAEVLAAELTAIARQNDENTAQVTVDRARQLVAHRVTAWFKNLADFGTQVQDLHLPPYDGFLSVGSRYFLANGRAKCGSATTNMQVLLDRDLPESITPGSNWPTIIWQRIL